MNIVDMEIIHCSWTCVHPRIKGMAGPVFVMLHQVEAPLELFAVEIECQQTVESRGGQKQLSVLSHYLVAVLEIAIFVRCHDLEITVIAKQLVARRNIDLVAVKRDSTKAAVGAPPFPINLAGIPVNRQFTGLILEIDNGYAAMALALPASPDNRGGDQLR